MKFFGYEINMRRINILVLILISLIVFKVLAQQEKLFTVGGAGITPINGIVNIFRESDFPVAVANVITLDEDLQYRVSGTVTLSAGISIDLNGSPLFGNSNIYSKIIGNVTTDGIITSSDDDVFIKDLQLSNPNGEIFENITGNVGKTVDFQCDNCIFDNSTEVGLINGGFRFVRFIDSEATNNSDGLTIKGDINSVFFNGYISLDSNSGSFVNIPSGTIGNITLDGSCILEAGIGETALLIDNAVATIDQITILNSYFLGAGTMTASFLINDTNVVVDAMVADQLVETYNVPDFSINSSTVVDAIQDDDTMAMCSDTDLITCESIKAYVDLGSAFPKILDANNALYPSTNPASAFSRNGHPIIVFDDTTAESVIFTNSAGSEYGGDDITVNIDWVAETAITGGVTWGVSFEVNAASGNDIDSDSFAAQQTGTSSANATSGIITRTSITLTQAQADSITADDYFRMAVERVTGDVGDDMVGDAQILKITLTN